MELVHKGRTSFILEVFIQDNSVGTGAGLSGLAYNSGGLTAYYHRNTAAAAVAITLVTMTAGTWASGGFKEVDATNLKGVYQIGIPDAALATGADSVTISIFGASNMAQVIFKIPLTNLDMQGTGAELTSLASATNLAAAKTVVDAVKVKTDSLTFTVAGMADANVINWKGATAPAMTGDAFARLGAPAAASVSADNLLIYNRLGAPSGASVSADVAALFTTQMTEAYAADGVAPTPAQMLFMLWSMLAEKNISSTTLTSKKLDGSTTAMTFTLDSATTPTSITRAS